MSQKPLHPTSENPDHAPTFTGEKNRERIFTDEEMGNLLSFYHTLKKIHTRLIQEGYTIKNGKIRPPKKSRHS